MSSKVSNHLYAAHLAEAEIASAGDSLRSMGACGYTLLDVIDHLLDYNKVNQFNKSSPRLSMAKKGHGPDCQGLSRPMLAAQTFDVDIADLVEESIDSMFAGHNCKQSYFPSYPTPLPSSLDRNHYLRRRHMPIHSRQPY